MTNLIHNIKNQLIRTGSFLHINNNKSNPIFSRSGGASPVSVLQPWYDSLSVKPSAGLWSDLKTMADGMNSDGDWAEADLVSLLAGLETDEQRLRPLKTTSGLDMVAITSPTLDVNGITCNGTTSYINTNWNAFTNGIKYTLNNSCVLFYNSSLCASNRSYFGTFDTTLIQRITNAYRFGINSVGNSPTDITGYSDCLGLKAIYRTDATNQSIYAKSTIQSQVYVSSILDNYNCFLGCKNNAGTPVAFSNATNRFLAYGSGLIIPTRVEARINTFFTARGLTTF